MTLDIHRKDAASGEARQLVILLHGYGADGADLIGLADPLAPHLPHATFIAPNAPDRCAVNPMGFQWFPISWIDGSSEDAMRAGFARAAETLDSWLTEIMDAEGVDEADTALVGFSQGTMMSLHTGLRRPRALAGIVGFSGRLPEADEAASPVTAKPPVLLVHGDQDDVIPVAALDEARNGLAALGVEVQWHVSRGVGHGIAPDGLSLALRFLSARFGLIDG